MKRTLSAVGARAFTLGIKRNINYWTSEEDDILIKYYPTEGQECFKRFLNKSKKEVLHRSSYLHLKTIFNYWTLEEDNIIRQYYSTEGSNCKRRISNKKDKSNEAIMRRANLLGVNLEQSSKNRLWTEEENKILEKYYPTEGANVYKRLNNRTKNQCMGQAFKLGLKMNKIWTIEEDNIIRQYYPIEGTKCSKRLPGKSAEACRHRAQRLDIKHISEDNWEDWEIALLIKYYPIEGKKSFSRVKNHSAVGCSHKCVKLGLHINKQRILCVETGEIFTSISSASSKYHCNNIALCCKGIRKSAGQLPDGTKLHWKYVEDSE